METKLFCAYPEDYIAQAAACMADGLLFHDSTLRKKKIKLKALMKAHWPNFVPRPSIAVVYDDTVDLDGNRHHIYRYEDSESRFLGLLEQGEKLIFCDGYSPLVKKPGDVAIRWVVWLLREAERAGAQIHLMNLYDLKPLLDHPVASGDVKFKVMADQKYVKLPNSQRVGERGIKAKQHQSWFQAVGVMPSEINEWGDYIQFNIKSFTYGLAEVKNNPNFELPVREYEHTPEGLEAHQNQEHNNNPERRNQEVAKRKEGQVCDLCVIKRCSLRTPGAVCAKEESQFLGLAEHFQTRDTRVITMGLQHVLADAGDRYMKARAQEEKDAIKEDGTPGDFYIQKSVTQLGAQIQKSGIELMKILDPRLNTQTILIPVAAQQNPKIRKALEARGEIIDAEEA